MDGGFFLTAIWLLFYYTPGGLQELLFIISGVVSFRSL